jgi:hypothetical protein
MLASTWAQDGRSNALRCIHPLARKKDDKVALVRPLVPGITSLAMFGIDLIFLSGLFLLASGPTNVGLPLCQGAVKSVPLHRGGGRFTIHGEVCT